ncbi:MAG TPA: GNAT family N-acetyltransferase [Acidimicrobiales bacterium]
MSTLLNRLERYYDTVPRATVTAELIGPFTLFVATEGFPYPYYARPTLGLGAGVAPTVGDVEVVRARQRTLGVPEAFEWVEENSPALTSLLQEAGLVVHRHPLLVLGQPKWPEDPLGISVRIAGSDDEALVGLRATLDIGFAHEGTAIGVPGVAERDAAVREDDPGLANWRSKSAQGLLALAVAEDQTGVVGGGLHNPRDGVTEVAGIATLPAYRRRGIAAAVTAQLVSDALERGVDICFLSAESDAVARIYERLGFERVGTACTAEPPG